jgi:hypothetical protein
MSLVGRTLIFPGFRLVNLAARGLEVYFLVHDHAPVVDDSGAKRESLREG